MRKSCDHAASSDKSNSVAGIVKAVCRDLLILETYILRENTLSEREGGDCMVQAQCPVCPQPLSVPGRQGYVAAAPVQSPATV